MSKLFKFVIGTSLVLLALSSVMTVVSTFYATSGQGAVVAGPMGEQGAQGPAGTAGTAGEDGAAGVPGQQGAPGPAGQTGPAGATGAQGATGATGAQGATGASGLTWLGVWQPSVTYVANDAVSYSSASWFAIGDTPAGEVPTLSSTYWVPLALQGATGPMGPTGVINASGPLIYSSGSQSLSLDMDAFSHIGNLDYLQFNTSSAATNAPGRLVWNDIDGTLSLQGKNGGITYQLGQENAQLVENVSGSQINDGKVVRIVGANAHMQVDIADSTTASTANAVLGVATQNIDNNSQGYVTTYGVVHGFNTVGMAGGSAVYLGTSGNLTTTWPSSGVVVRIGYVLIGNSASGAIYVEQLQNLTPPLGGACVVPGETNPGVYAWYAVAAGLRYAIVCDIQ